MSEFDFCPLYPTPIKDKDFKIGSFIYLIILFVPSYETKKLKDKLNVIDSFLRTVTQNLCQGKIPGIPR